TATCRGEAASPTSTAHSSRTSRVQPSTTIGTGTSSTGSTPAAVSVTARHVIVIVGPADRSAGDRHGGQHRVQHALGGHALELGLGPELHPVAQRRVGQGLDVVGADVPTAG